MGRKRVAFASMVLIANSAWAATERPVVEISCRRGLQRRPAKPTFEGAAPPVRTVPKPGCDRGRRGRNPSKHTKREAFGDVLTITLSVKGRQSCFNLRCTM